MDDNINIAICDDDEIDADRIAELCGKSEILSKYNVNISQYHSGEDLCNAKEVYNLIFLDIKLDNMDGIAIRDHLRISQPDALIAYATGYSEYATRAYGRNVIDYIMKPITLDKVDEVIHTLMLERSINKDINIISNGNIVNIKSLDIIYIKAEHVYSVVIMRDSKYLVRRTMNEWEQELSVYGFVRVGKSYIVNFRYVSCIDKENDKRIKDILEQQKRYCELIDDQNIETRSFRHDMNAHMNSISYLIERRMYKELDNYIKELTKSYSAIPKRVDVGNYIADAIVQETVYEAKKINADFEYRGRMTEAMKDREYDICIILSNLLNNAIEAVEKLSDDSPKNIRLDIRNYNNKTIIIVRNTDMVNNVSLITTKADVRDHGFGLYNVKKSVKALKGDMKISHRESEFVVTITI